MVLENLLNDYNETWYTFLAIFLAISITYFLVKMIVSIYRWIKANR